MDDPLRPSSRARYWHDDSAAMDFVTRLKCAAPASLRVFTSALEKSYDTPVSSVKEVLEPATPIEDEIDSDLDILPGTNLNVEFKQDVKELTWISEVYRPSDHGLKLIMGTGDGQRESLSLSRNDFCRIVDECEFPVEFAQSILTNNGSMARFTTYESVNGKEVPSALSVIVQTPYSPFMNFSCVLRANILDRSATGLFFLKEHHKTANLLKQLHSSRELLHKNPISLISILLQEHGYSCERYRALLDMNVVEMERKTGHTSIAISLFQPSPNYEKLTRDLNACKTSLIFLDNMSVFERELGVFCKETLREFEGLRHERRSCLNESKRSDAFCSKAELVAAQQRLDYHLNLAQMRRTQALSLTRRVETQISVLYSLISQRDSKINILVAEDSQKIAIAAKRDSTAMKTISIVTMVFLPGTFVASIFSAGIFDFQIRTTGSRIGVAKYWWVYFVVTMTLTLSTVAIWAFYTRKRGVDVSREEKIGKREKKL